MQQTAGAKRIIHEYHRIEIDPKDVVTNRVIVIEPQPSEIRPAASPIRNVLLAACMAQKNCSACVSFKEPCIWCDSMNEKFGGFCSDEDGKHRWYEQFHKECRNSVNTYCF